MINKNPKYEKNDESINKNDRLVSDMHRKKKNSKSNSDVNHTNMNFQSKICDNATKEYYCNYDTNNKYQKTSETSRKPNFLSKLNTLPTNETSATFREQSKNNFSKKDFCLQFGINSNNLNKEASYRDKYVSSIDISNNHSKTFEKSEVNLKKSKDFRTQMHSQDFKDKENTASQNLFRGHQKSISSFVGLNKYKEKENITKSFNGNVTNNNKNNSSISQNHFLMLGTNMFNQNTHSN